MVHRLFLTGAILLAFAGAASSASVESKVSVDREHFSYRFDSEEFVPIADLALAKARIRLIEIIHDSLPYKPTVYIVDDQKKFEKLELIRTHQENMKAENQPFSHCFLKNRVDERVVLLL